MLARKKVRFDPRLPWFQDVHRVLSPMSGITDRSFRDICRPFGVQLGFCEFASASGLMYGGEATWRLIDTAEEADPVGVQIFGAEPEHMAAAARLVGEHHLDVLDLNFGCPAKKVVKKCGGSALLADVPLLERIVREVMEASEVPVTAKIRTGWDEGSVNYREVGLLLQDLGVSWVTMHGRTRNQKYRGRANWDRIADLVETLDIPVIGNGDVIDAASYAALVGHAGCHAVMIGRGAIGNPWLFTEMRAVDEGDAWLPPSFEERCAVMSDYVRREVAWKGEKTGCLDVRKHLARCFKGYPGAALLRKRLFATEDSSTLLAILAAVARDGGPGGV